MFLGKLWVRIRGELLTLRDDVLGEGKLSDKTKEFLEKVEHNLDAPGSRFDADSNVVERLDAVTRRVDELEKSVGARKEMLDSHSAPGVRSVEALEKALDELKRSRESGEEQSSDEPTPPPNPRTLG